MLPVLLFPEQALGKMDHMPMPTLTCFNADDIHGKIGEEISEDIAYRIGRAFGEYYASRSVSIACDIRLTSEALNQAVPSGLRDSGSDVIDIGLCGIEGIYFAVFHLNVDDGIEITASHNPQDYNGMKLVQGCARPISRDSDLTILQHLAENNAFSSLQMPGSLVHDALLNAYANYLLDYVDSTAMRPLRLVVNAGNGVVGHLIDALNARFQADQVPCTFSKIHNRQDGTFPHVAPNTLLLGNQADTASTVFNTGTDIDITLGDNCNRCFFFDANCRFIDDYYILGVLAWALLCKHPGSKIMHSQCYTWNTIEILQRASGAISQRRTDHVFIMEMIRQKHTIYGGEIISPHYFRDFGYCNSGMIPWLRLIDLMSLAGRSLLDMVDERMAAYPCSEKINYSVAPNEATLEGVFDRSPPPPPANGGGSC